MQVYVLRSGRSYEEQMCTVSWSGSPWRITLSVSNPYQFMRSSSTRSTQQGHFAGV